MYKSVQTQQLDPRRFALQQEPPSNHKAGNRGWVIGGHNLPMTLRYLHQQMQEGHRLQLRTSGSARRLLSALVQSEANSSFGAAMFLVK